MNVLHMAFDFEAWSVIISLKFKFILRRGLFLFFYRAATHAPYTYIHTQLLIITLLSGLLLTSHATYVCLFDTWVQFKVNFERQILEKLFMAIWFATRVFARNRLRGSRWTNIYFIFHFVIDVWPNFWTVGLNQHATF